jgi:hypothetical protein
MIPSVAVVLNGLMFWSFTSFMIYLMPIIRIWNIVLMMMIQRMKYLRWGIYLWGLIKSVLIFVSVYWLIYTWVLPDVFLTMAIVQMITVLIGGSGVQLLKRYI